MHNLDFNLSHLSDNSLVELHKTFQKSFKTGYLKCISTQNTKPDVIDQIVTVYNIEDGQPTQVTEDKLPKDLPELLTVKYNCSSGISPSITLYGEPSKTGKTLASAFPKFGKELIKQSKLRAAKPDETAECAFVTQLSGSTRITFNGAVLQKGKILEKTAFDLEDLFSVLGFGTLDLTYDTEDKVFNRKFKKKVSKKLYPKADLQFAKMKYYCTKQGPEFENVADPFFIIHQVTAEIFRLRSAAELLRRKQSASGLVTRTLEAQMKTALIQSQRSLFKLLPEQIYQKAFAYIYSLAQQDAAEDEPELLEILEKILNVTSTGEPQIVIG